MTACTFGPHVVTACSAHAALWRSLLDAGTPLWAYLAAVAAVVLAVWAWGRARDRYELIGRRPVRRWYGTGAWVILRRDAAAAAIPALWEVAAWDSHVTGIPWLLASPVDDEDADAFWAPVTDFEPYAIRRLRPWLWRHGWLRLPMLTVRETLPVTYPRGRS